MKDYTKESLSMYEKKYLKSIIISTKNMYLRKNQKIIDNQIISLNENLDIRSEDFLEELQRKEEKEISKEEFEKVILDFELYKIIKALTLNEKEVLFYLFKEGKNITQIANRLNKDRRTVRKWRDSAFEKIRNQMERRKKDEK